MGNEIDKEKPIILDLESIKIKKPGQYELDLVNLFEKKQPLILPSGEQTVLTSEKIALIITIWILIVLLLTGDTALELFFILIFIGVLIVRELSDIFTTSNLKDRLNVIIYIFILIFIVIVGRKVLTVLNI